MWYYLRDFTVEQKSKRFSKETEVSYPGKKWAVAGNDWVREFNWTTLYFDNVTNGTKQLKINTRYYPVSRTFWKNKLNKRKLRYQNSTERGRRITQTKFEQAPYHQQTHKILKQEAQSQCDKFRRWGAKTNEGTYTKRISERYQNSTRDGRQNFS